MKKCRHCKSSYNDIEKQCPYCGATKFLTEEDLTAKAIAEDEQRQKEDVIKNEHKRRVLIAAIAAMAVVAVVVIGIIVGNSIENNRVIYVDGVALPTKNQMADAYEMGMAYYNAGDLGNAIDQLSIVDERSPKFRDAQKTIIAANAKYRDQQITIAETYVQSGDYVAAFAKVDGVYQAMPTDSVVVAKREEIQALLAAQNAQTKANAATQANERLQQNDYASAISILNTALSAMPDDAELKNMLISTKAAYKNDYIQRIDVLINSGKNTEASALIQTALQVFPNDAELLSKASALQTSNILAEAATKEAQGDLAGAIAVLRKADDTTKQNPMFIEMQNRLEANYKKQIIVDAEETYHVRGYLEASQVIQNGLKIFPEDAELTALHTGYLAKAPVDMLALYEELEQKYCYVHSNGEDNLGNSYGRIISPDSSYSNTHITFYVNGEYEKLTGTVYVRNKAKSTRNTQSLKIYGDDVLLYESPALGAGVLPIDFEVSISGVSKLKFATEGGNGNYGVIQVGNLLLYR